MGHISPLLLTSPGVLFPLGAYQKAWWVPLTSRLLRCQLALVRMLHLLCVLIGWRSERERAGGSL